MKKWLKNEIGFILYMITLCTSIILLAYCARSEAKSCKEPTIGSIIQKENWSATIAELYEFYPQDNKAVRENLEYIQTHVRKKYYTEKRSWILKNKKRRCGNDSKNN